MTLHQLNILNVLVESQGYKAAADKLYLSQPSISAQIKSLENSLGITLIDRAESAKIKGIALTEEGNIAYEYVKKILCEADSLRQYTKEAEHNKKSRLSILTNTPIGTYVMPILISNSVESGADIHIKLMIKTDYDELTRFAMSSSYDICIAPIPNYPLKESIMLTFEIPIVLVTLNKEMANHEVNFFAENNLTNMFDRILLPSRNSGTRGVINTFFEKRKITLKGVEIDNTETLKKILLRSPNCGAFVSSITVADEIRSGYFYRIKTVPPLPCVQYVVIKRTGTKSNKQVDNLIHDLLQYITETASLLFGDTDCNLL